MFWALVAVTAYLLWMVWMLSRRVWRLEAVARELCSRAGVDPALTINAADRADLAARRR